MQQDSSLCIQLLDSIGSERKVDFCLEREMLKYDTFFDMSE